MNINSHRGKSFTLRKHLGSNIFPSKKGNYYSNLPTSQDRGRYTRGYNYYEAIPKHRGLCSALGNHVLDYSQKASSDQIRTTWEKLVHHIVTIHGQNISNELLNKIL